MRTDNLSKDPSSVKINTNFHYFNIMNCDQALFNRFHLVNPILRKRETSDSVRINKSNDKIRPGRRYC